MSALAHYLEAEGLPTVAIALLRDHAERVSPPRALWVPFELGRPLGPPGDGQFQRRVLLAALDRLVAAMAPGTIVDFSEDDPRTCPDPNWTPPFAVPLPDLAAATNDAIAARLVPEIRRLRPFYDVAATTRGRTTVGLTALPIPSIGNYLADILRGYPIASPVSGLSAPLTLRFAADDLKAFHLESAIGLAHRPSSRQLLDWFWRSTWAGRALIAVRAHILTTTSDRRLAAVAQRFLVPRVRIPGSP